MDKESGEQLDSLLLRARLAAIIDSSDDVIISKTLDGIITSWNPAAVRVFGWSAAEAIGRHITLIIPTERRAEEDDVLARIRRGERVDHFETVRVTKDGQLVDVAITVSPVRDGTGRVVGASKVARDIGERRRGEVALARLAALVDSSDDIIVSKTLDGIITSWNPTAERILGWMAAEAIGRHITLIIPEERRAEEEDVLARIRRGERVDHFETVRITKDGRLLDLSITVSPIRDGAGRIVGASKIARDISERRRLEHQRAALLASEQEARQRAETLNRTKDELLATVSHELRTPMNSIFGWARMMQSHEMDEPARARAIGAIIRNVSALGRLVEDLLDLSRIVTGRMRLDFQVIDFMTVVEAAIDTVRPAAHAKGIAMAATTSGVLGRIQGAPDRLQQVVWNLLMNAVKFTPAGGRVDVSVRRSGPMLEMSVADTGEGIPSDLLPYVFDPFRQGDSSSTRLHGGLGLGLALVRELVELHGGHVRAESAGKGSGATFTVTLPLASSATGEPMAETPDGASDTSQQAAALQGVRVLIVDDDLEFLELATMMLRQTGADVRTASSAYGAYGAVKSWEPSVVLTDIAMPAEDGFMLLGTLRATFSRHVPVVAVTAYATPENRARVAQAGFDLCLVKPVDPLDLTDAIARVLQRAR
jgi:PAS domain S-box-containing protein